MFDDVLLNPVINIDLGKYLERRRKQQKNGTESNRFAAVLNRICRARHQLSALHFLEMRLS
jgi:hypothetical protein